MLVINFFAGAGAGKSTISADVFCKLKKLGYRCELVNEFAKELILSGNLEPLNDQIYLFAEQLHRLRSYDKHGTQIAICDSPLVLSLVYDRNHEGKEFSDLVWKQFNSYKNLNYMLERIDGFWQADGRVGNESIARQKDVEIIGLLSGVEYKTISPFESDLVVDDVTSMKPVSYRM